MIRSLLHSTLATADTPYHSLFGMPAPESTIAPAVDIVYDIITWISIFFFVLIVVLMVVFMIKYRRRSHVTSTGGLTHNTPLEVTWTVIPLILVIAIFYVGLKGYVHITTPPENAYEIEVIGQRWFWTFQHPNGASETNVLDVPANWPVKLTMRSTDVLHSLFVPVFRVKQDVVPGRRTVLWFEATGTGEFDLFCTEYCGTQHSQMIGKVMVHDMDEFQAIIDEKANWIKRVPDDRLHLAGTQIYNQCASCHTLDGSPLIGPSFKETHDLYVNGGTRRLADGSTVTVDEDYLRDSILNPLDRIAVHSDTGQAYPNSMPAGLGSQLGPKKVEAMVRFIMKLDETAPDGRLLEIDRSEIAGQSQESESE